MNKYNQTARIHPRQVAPSWACGTSDSGSDYQKCERVRQMKQKRGLAPEQKHNHNEMWDIWWIAERWPKPVRKQEQEMDADQKSTSTVR